MRLLEKIFSVKNEAIYKVVCICGIKIKVKNKIKLLQNHLLDVVSKCENLENSLNSLINEHLRADLEIKLKAKSVHKETFSSFKNIHKDDIVVLCASGPTIKNFHGINDAKYIGVNKVFLQNNIKLDYLFIQDNLGAEIMNEASAYVGRNCQKFYGELSKLRINEILPIDKIPLSYINDANAKNYILEKGLDYSFAYDLENVPMGDFAGTVFSAMQFILFTGAKKIFLVGCDCSQGYFYDKESRNDASYQIESWKKIKEIVDRYYPDTEIISINPVGLKGIFKDEYQGETVEK